MSARRPPRAPSSRRLRVGVPLAILVLLAAWIGTGITRIDPDREAVILCGPLPGLPRVVGTAYAVAPKGLARVVRVPRIPFEVPLPDAETLRLRSREGALVGFEGAARLELLPDGEGRLAEALQRARSTGVAGVLAAAIREAGGSLQWGGMGSGIPHPTRVALERGLATALEGRGLRLLDLRVERRGFLVARDPERVAPSGAKVLVVGLDGADWSILDPLLAAGRLPHLERLISRGARAKLQSVSPIISPVIWTTIATGVEPERHGILDFLVPAGRPREGEPVTSTERRAAALWEILSARGIPVGVVGWWATWPAERVEGYIVADRVAYQLFGFRPDPSQSEGKTWPRALYEAIAPGIVEPSSVGWEEVRPYLDGERLAPEAFSPEERRLLDDFRTLIAAGRTYVGAALEARRLHPPRFEAVYLEGTDTVGHLFMPYRDPPLAGVDPARRASFRAVVDRYYETADAQLGRLLEGKGDDWTVLVVSDHGFATDDGRPRTTDSRIGHGPAADWHRRFGMLVLSGAKVRPGARIEEASVYDVAPTILALFGLPVPASWPGRVLGEAIEPTFFDAHPVLVRTDDPQRRDRIDPPELEDAEAEALRERLTSLGYIAPTPEAGRASSTAGENNRGVALLAAGRFEEAETAFRTALESEPDQPMLLVNLALSLRFQGRDAEAERLFERTFAAPTARRTAGLQLSQIAVDRGDLGRAERILREVLEAEPGAADVRNSLGLVLEKRGDEAGAERAYAIAARMDPDAAEPRNNLGNLARRAGRLDEAERRYLDAIDANPFFLGAYNNLALVYQEQGRLGEAIALYGRALEKSPENAVVMNNLGSLYFATGEIGEARALWERAADADPNYASPRNNLAGIALTEGRIEEAERLLEEALRIDPRYGDARINLALAARSLGDVARARSQLTAAAEDPRAAGSALVQLGAMELAEGRPEAARRALLRAVELRPSDPEAWTLLGEAARRLGRTGETRRAWERSLRLRPGQEGLERALESLR